MNGIQVGNNQRYSSPMNSNIGQNRGGFIGGCDVTTAIATVSLISAFMRR